MEGKIMRWMISASFVLIGLFTLLMAINLIGSFTGKRYDAPEKADAAKPLSAEEQANQALAAAKQAGGGSANMAPYYKQKFSSSAVTSDGSIMLVKEKGFKEVAEKPKTMNEVLEELSGGDRKKPAPVAMKAKDLDKKINIGGSEGLDPKLKVSTMPELGRGTGQESATMLKAPVDFKVFKSSDTWQAFAITHKCMSPMADKPGLNKIATPLIAPDFAKEWIVVLVSLSDLPNGIFKIVKVEKTGKTLTVNYRLDPLAMSAASTRDQHDFYSASTIPPNLPVKLVQVP
jgi:hypothetical protein